MKKRVLTIFGTRPEAIKMAPVIKALENENEYIESRVCITAQHREMLDQVLELFDIKPHYDLNIMKQGQSLYDITATILLKLQDVLDDFQPDLILVHGDTSTTFTSSLAAFYKKIAIAHIEAGLRTHNIYSPWPEEANRKLTAVLTNYHFAPTLKAKENLLKEGYQEENIIVTGNSVIDALFLILEKIEKTPQLKKKILSSLQKKIPNFDIDQKKFILVTGHRRENFGEGFLNLCNALKDIAKKNPKIGIIYPVHLNPNVQKPVFEILSDVQNVFLIDPLEYDEFLYLMNKSYFIITDSGGIQEEAPSLGKPLLVTRDTTERPEALEAGVVKLVGSNREKIINEAQKLIDDLDEYKKMSQASNPYGSGEASKKIIHFLKEVL